MSDNKISFGRIFWPSFLAIFIMSIFGLILFSLIIGGLIGGFSDFGPKPLAIKNNTILHMTLDGQINEKAEAQFDPSSFSLEKKIGLSDLLYGIKYAETDPKIKGIFLEIADLTCGYATIHSLRNALIDFQKSGKFIIAYNSGEVISQKEYYLTSVAKENYAFPTSMMEITGLGAELTFFKGSLDKLGVEVEIIRGSNNDFKSAVEPFFRTNMSDSSRVQIERYLQSMWQDMRKEIATSRKIRETDLNIIADSVKIRRAEDALKYKLIDGVKYRDEIISMLAKKIGIETDEEIAFQPLEKYAKKKFYQKQLLAKSDKPNIAVILAEGSIDKDGDELSSNEVCKLFQEVRKNNSIKTVVFRINSPGGSALASDEIWREVKITNAVKKVIVSMGDVAASGGYYIAAPAARIFAEPMTITGSIGVFGMIPYTGKMFEEKLGISFDYASTNKHAIMSLNKKLTDEELRIAQEEVDKIYLQFLTRVSEGRKMTVDAVNQIARGRVWTGTDAQKIGLVDELGGLEKAIAYAARKANITDNKILYYPLKKEDKFETFLEVIEDEEAANEVRIRQHSLPKELLIQYQKLEKIQKLRGIQMRLPYELRLN
jgi:protease-4